MRIAFDSTTLVANAAMRSIMVCDTGRAMKLRSLAKAPRIETSTRPEMVRLERKCKKRTSNKD